jgi:hypothetical protein
MAKSKSTKSLIEQDIPVSFNLSHVVATDYIRAAIERSVESTVDEAVKEAVGAAVATAVDRISRERITKEVERVMAEGWSTTNNYGESTGVRMSIKDRIGKILNGRDSYSGRDSYIDETVKRQVQEALNKDLKGDIGAARDKFKAEVDAVLTATIREALAKNLGLKS